MQLETDGEFDAIFTTDRQIIFAFHGYPSLIDQLTCRRTNHGNLHVSGYKEEGTTMTPFEMVVMDKMDRFQLVMDVEAIVAKINIYVTSRISMDAARPRSRSSTQPLATLCR